MNWFKRLCLPEEYPSTTLATLRRRLLMMPGQFVPTRERGCARLLETPRTGGLSCAAPVSGTGQPA